MTEKDFQVLKQRMLAELEGLDPHLTYHSKAHTIDVIEQCINIGKREGIEGHDMMLLKMAALFHDTGFLRTYLNHEAMGCNIFTEKTAAFHFSANDNKVVKELIMATRLPQAPANHLQSIICDADLDYLGRDDFFTIGDNLRTEFLHFKIVPDSEAWEKMQLNFLKTHHYHTRSSQQLREPVKQQHYAELVGEM
ncbi:MAG TPA: phosphohydrolase [Ferruginibacter sp.]|nr:phosphohydrolase [Ferruginibacter sp.]